MMIIRATFVAVAILGVASTGMALAQTTAPSTAPTTSPVATAADDVGKWTRKEWNAARAKYAKEKEKWADCRKQSADQKLTGRKSWSFLASCMTS
jgi:hypothetical protein